MREGVARAMSFPVNRIVQPEGADFDSSGLTCWQRNAWVMMREGGRVRTTGWIERFIEVYHAAHSAATLPVLLLPIEVFASGGSMVPPQSLY